MVAMMICRRWGRSPLHRSFGCNLFSDRSGVRRYQAGFAAETMVSEGLVSETTASLAPPSNKRGIRGSEEGSNLSDVMVSNAYSSRTDVNRSSEGGSPSSELMVSEALSPEKDCITCPKEDLSSRNELNEASRLATNLTIPPAEQEDTFSASKEIISSEEKAEEGYDFRTLPEEVISSEEKTEEGYDFRTLPDLKSSSYENYELPSSMLRRQKRPPLLKSLNLASNALFQNKVGMESIPPFKGIPYNFGLKNIMPIAPLPAEASGGFDINISFDNLDEQVSSKEEAMPPLLGRINSTSIYSKEAYNSRPFPELKNSSYMNYEVPNAVLQWRKSPLAQMKGVSRFFNQKPGVESIPQGKGIPYDFGLKEMPSSTPSSLAGTGFDMNISFENFEDEGFVEDPSSSHILPTKLPDVDSPLVL